MAGPAAGSSMLAAMTGSFRVPQRSRQQAYVILGGAALMMTIAMGIRQNLGQFQAAAWDLSQPVAGVLADKHGTRGVAMAGGVTLLVGMLLTATRPAPSSAPTRMQALQAAM